MDTNIAKDTRSLAHVKFPTMLRYVASVGQPLDQQSGHLTYAIGTLLTPPPAPAFACRH